MFEFSDSEGYMDNCPENYRLNTLISKGGVMFFTIEKPERVYSGMIILSPVKHNYRRRAVYIKEYKYNEFKGNLGGVK